MSRTSAAVRPAPAAAPRRAGPAAKPAPKRAPAEAEAKAEDERPSGPIVPAATVSGRSLSLVIAIMTFLACLTLGAVTLVSETASRWESAVASEVVIQIRPIPGVDIDAAATRAAALARAMPGIATAQILSEADNAALLEPWLGADADLAALPVPRLVVLSVVPGDAPDLADLRARLTEIRGASLDDHRVWQERLRSMAGTLVILGLSVLGLVLMATVLTVVFATRGAMASNRDIVAVLDFVGASQSYIAREFQRQFWKLGFRGAVVGGGLALLVLLGAHWSLGRFGSGAGASQIDLLFGNLTVGMIGYAGAAGLVLVIAGLTATTSRLAVLNALKRGTGRG